MIVVDEIRIPVIDALVIRYVGERSVDTDTIGDDFRQRPAGTDKVVIDLTGADLVAHQDAILELIV